MSQLLEKIKSDYTQALKEKRVDEVSVLRFLLADLHNKEIEKRGELTDEEVITVLQKQMKIRKEAIEGFKLGKREDLANKEKAEAGILSKYLPQMISSEELEKIIDSAIARTEAHGPQDMGRVIGEVMKEVKGKAEGQVVADLVKKHLAVAQNDLV